MWISRSPGVVTVARLGQINWEDAIWVQGMNRIRHAYLDIAPELGPYFVTSKYDDDRGEWVYASDVDSDDDDD